MKLFCYQGRVQSIRHAISGIFLLLSSQQSAWIHGFATTVVTISGLWFGLSAIEWSLIIVVTIAVWTAEALNTAFEFLCDVASPEFHPMVKNAKDVAAGAVLLSAVGAAVVGILVFAPHVKELLH